VIKGLLRGSAINNFQHSFFDLLQIGNNLEEVFRLRIRRTGAPNPQATPATDAGAAILPSLPAPGRAP
jgi:hypothetical protein